MPIYEIAAPNGSIYEVEGPENADQNALFAVVQKEVERERREETRKRALDDTGTIGNFFKGFGTGAVGLFESAALGGAAALDEDWEAPVRQGILSVADALKPEGGDPDAVSYNLGSTMGSIAAPVPLAFLGPVGAAASGGIFALAGSGEASERARRAGATEEVRGQAALKGLAPGSLDVIPQLRITRFAKQLQGPLMKKLVSRFGKKPIEGWMDRIRSAAVTGGIEGAQEVTQEIMQNMIQQGYDPAQELVEGLGHAGGYGAAGGAIVQALVDLAVPGKPRGGGTDTDTDTDTFDFDDTPITPEQFDPAILPEQFAPLREQDIPIAPKRFDTAIPPEGFTPLTGKERDEVSVGLTKEDLPGQQGEMFGIASLLPRPQQPLQAGDRASGPPMYRNKQGVPFPVERTPDQPVERILKEPQFDIEGMIADRKQRDRKSKADLDRKIAAKDAEVAAAQQARSRARRLQILTDVAQENATTTNPDLLARKFVDKLHEEGLTDTEASPFELQAIRAVAEDRVNSNLPAIPEIPVGRETPEQNAAMEAAVGQGVRDDRVSTPEQPPTGVGVSDIGQPVGPVPDRRVPPTPDTGRIAALGTTDTGLAGAGRDVTAPEVRAAAQPAPLETPTEKLDKRAADAKVARIRAEQKKREQLLNDPAAMEAYAEDKGISLEEMQSLINTNYENGAQYLAEAEAEAAAAQRANTEGIKFQDIEAQPAPLDQEPTAPVQDEGGVTATPEPTEEVEAAPAEALSRKEEVKQPTEEAKAKAMPLHEWQEQERKKKEKQEQERKEKEKEKEEEAKLEAHEEEFEKKRPKATAKRAEKAAKLGQQTRVLEYADTEEARNLLSNKDKQAIAKVVTRTPGRFDRVKDGSTREEWQQARAAKTYFEDQRNPVNGILEAISDYVMGKTKTFPVGATGYKASKAEALVEAEKKYYTGKNKNQAKLALEWLTDNLYTDITPFLLRYIRKETHLRQSILNTKPHSVTLARKLKADAEWHAAVAQYEQFKRSTKKTKAQRIDEAMSKLDVRRLTARTLAEPERSERLEALDLLEDNLIAAKSMEGEVYVDDTTGEIVKKGQYLKNVLKKIDALELPADAINVLDMPLHPQVVKSLRQGDLDEAMIEIATTSGNPLIRRAARLFLKNLGTTKVKVVRDLKNDKGKPISGMFDPKTNTVMLNAQRANSTHTILHEVAHALTSATLANKSHKLTKQLNKLFNEIRGELDTAYGTKSLDEFVSEAFSNEAFQQKLATILDKDAVSGWQKFKTYVGNFFRQMFGKKPIPVHDTTYTQLNEMLEALLAPAPESRFADALHMPTLLGEGGKIAEMLGAYHVAADKAANKHPIGAHYADRMGDFLSSNLPDKFKRVVAGFAPSQPLADIIRQRFGEEAGEIAMKIHQLFLDGDAAVWNQRGHLEATLKELRSLAVASPADMDILNELHTEATRLKVDPDPRRVHPNDKIGRKAYEDNQQKLADYDKLVKQFNRMGPEAQRMYRRVREIYKKLNDRMHDMLLLRIKHTINDEKQYLKIKNEIEQNLFNDLIDPYFPLIRTGSHWLVFKLKDSPELHKMSFDYLPTRNRVERQLREDDRVDQSSIETPNKLMDMKLQFGPNQQFVNDVLAGMRAASMGLDEEMKAHMDEQIEQVMRLFIQQLPETSFAKNLQHRQGTLGYVKDIIEGFENRAFDISRQAEQLNSGREMQYQLNLLNKLIKKDMGTRKENKLDTEGQIIWDELAKRVRFASNPPSDQYARMANRFAFLGTLGLNVSSALVNLTQVPMIVYPYMAAKTDWSTAGKALWAGYKLFTQAPTDFLTHDYLQDEHQVRIEAPKYAVFSRSIGNYYETRGNGTRWIVREDLDIDDSKEFAMGMTKKELLRKIAPIVQGLHDTAQDNRSIPHEILDLSESGKGAGRSLSISDKVNLVSAYMFHNAERMNRQTAAVGSFLNELQRLNDNPRKIKGEVGLEGDDLIDRAVTNALYDTLQTNGGAILSTAPRYAQKGIGRVALMFRTFGLQMYYHLGKTMREALDVEFAGDKEGQKIAQKQIVSTMGIITALTGVSGAVPMYSTIMDMMSLAFLDEDEPDFDAQVRMALPEIAYSGLSNEVTKLFGGEGLAVAQRIGIADIVLHHNRYNFDPSVEKSIVATLGGPFWGYSSSIIRGFEDIGRGNVQRGIESILPASVRNVMKATRYANEGALTRRQDAIMSSPTAGLLAAQAFGFAPAEYVRNQEANQIAKGIDRATNDRRTRLLKQYYLALRMQDTDMMREVRKNMQAYNKRHPNHAITAESIEKSYKQHMETTLNMTNGVLFSPKMRADMNQLVRDMRY